jgi:hypothetical protein
MGTLLHRAPYFDIGHSAFADCSRTENSLFLLFANVSYLLELGDAKKGWAGTRVSEMKSTSLPKPVTV